MWQQTSARGKFCFSSFLVQIRRWVAVIGQHICTVYTVCISWRAIKSFSPCDWTSTAHVIPAWNQPCNKPLWNFSYLGSAVWKIQFAILVPSKWNIIIYRRAAWYQPCAVCDTSTNFTTQTYSCSSLFFYIMWFWIWAFATFTVIFCIEN